MRVYGLTKLGRKMADTHTDDSDEMRVLQYLRDNRTATDDELDTVGERYIVRKLKHRGLIKELTRE